MYSGLLPRGLTKDDLSPDDEEDEQEDGDETRQEENRASVLEEKSAHNDVDSPTCSMPGISQGMWKVSCYSDEDKGSQSYDAEVNIPLTITLKSHYNAF